MKKAVSIVFYAMAGVYAFLMLDLLLRINVIGSGGNAVRSFNLVPFRTIWEYISGENGVTASLVRYNLLGNVVAFIPYGVYLQTLLKNKAYGKSLLIVVCTTIGIELVQYLLGVGAADIDDVILNVCGGMLGVMGYKLLMKLLRDESKVKTAITGVSLVIGAPVMLVYLMVCIRRYF